MFNNTRLLFIPSKKNFYLFKDFRNDHLNALFKTQDSLVDSICVQHDIIKDCLVDDRITIEDLNILDCFSIFVSWRVNCVNDELVLDMGKHFPQTIDIRTWMGIVHSLADESFKETIDLSRDGKVLKLNMDLPSLYDDFQSQLSYMTEEGDEILKRIESSNNLNSVCMMSSVSIGDNNSTFSTYQEKVELFNQLPPEAVKLMYGYSERVRNKFKSTSVSIILNENIIDFSVEIIPILVTRLFSGSPTVMLNNGLYLSKNCHVSYTDYLSMAPIESQHLLNTIQEAEEEQQKQQNGQ